MSSNRWCWALLLVCTSSARADDWPQWRGPQRTGVSVEKGWLTMWPREGPKLLWKIDTLGPGYSGPAVVGSRLYIMGSDGKNEFLVALDATTGREVWRVQLGPEFQNGWGNGPRGTPTVHDSYVVALGAQGVLVCVDAEKGREQWRTDLRKDHGGQLMRGNILDVDWGYSESPLVDGDRVVVSPGGAKGTVAALDLRTGKELWRTTTCRDSASYSSVIVAELAGVRQYVQLTGGIEYRSGAFMKSPPQAIGIAPNDGAILWQHKINYTTAGVINTPVAHKNLVYASCGYGGGCTILEIQTQDKRLQAKDCTTSETRRNLTVYHGGLLLHEDRVIGYSENAGWVGQTLPSGERRWDQKRGLPGGSHIRLGLHLIIVGTEGTVALVEIDDRGLTLRSEFTLPKVSAGRTANTKVKVCTHPVLANQRLYVRDQEMLYCYDVKAP